MVAEAERDECILRGCLRIVDDWDMIAFSVGAGLRYALLLRLSRIS